MKKTLCGIALLLTPVAAQAQAQANLNPAAFLATANHILTMIDQNQAGPVWDNASPKMKAGTRRDDFQRAIAQRRAATASPAGRDWASISRVHVAVASQTIPAGDYLTINEVGTGSRGAHTLESVSFTLDSDNVWRLAGYVIR